MYIFTDIADFKKFIGGAANQSLDIKSIEPMIQTAAENHLELWLGAQLPAAITAAEGTPNAETTKLLDAIKRPLAMLTMYEYLAINSIQVSDSGNLRVETDKRKSAYKYQENAYRNSMLNNGYEALEKMLKFLEANEADYPIWTADEAYQLNKSLFLNYATEFRANYSSYVSRYTFDLLRPLIEDIECFAILPLFGQAFFDEIKEGIFLKSLNANEKKLLKLVQKAVANFAIEEGMTRNWVRLEGRNVVQTEILGDQGNEKAIAAKNVPLGHTIRKADEWANRHMSKLKNYLTNNPGLFPLYDTYVEEQAAAAEAAAEEAEEAANCPEENSPKSRAIVRL